MQTHRTMSWTQNASDLPSLAWLSETERNAHASRVHRQGNTEGTPTRAPAGTRGYSSSSDSFFMRGFRTRGFPALPALPASLLDGKEGVDGSSPSEGLKRPANHDFVLSVLNRG